MVGVARLQHQPLAARADRFGDQAAELARGPLHPGRLFQVGDGRIVDLHRHALDVQPAIDLGIEDDQRVGRRDRRHVAGRGRRFRRQRDQPIGRPAAKAQAPRQKQQPGQHADVFDRSRHPAPPSCFDAHGL
jgi:hypothetical protein